MEGLLAMPVSQLRLLIHFNSSVAGMLAETEEQKMSIIFVFPLAST
jgi:hypothetical protein